MIRLFRDDDQVVLIATRALRLLCFAVLFLPSCMVTEMVTQSTGKKFVASIVSMIRSGLLLIPRLLILTKYRGLKGLQEAQPLTFILSIFPTIYFSTRYFKELPKVDS